MMVIIKYLGINMLMLANFFGISFICICLVATFLLGLYVIRIDKSLIKSKRKNLRFYEDSLLRSQLELQEQTLVQISQEIHDNIGQALTFVKLNLNTIDIAKQEETRIKLSEMSALVTTAIRDLRNLSKVSNTDYINNVGLVGCIQGQLEFLTKTGLYKAKLHLSEETYSLLPASETVLFRVVQEVLNNIVRHAEATTIDIYMDYSPELLIMKIVDNGKGFNIGPLKNKPLAKGLGLTTMQKRLSHIQGAINIESELGRGTQVNVFVSRSAVPSFEYLSDMCVKEGNVAGTSSLSSSGWPGRVSRGL